MNLITGYGSPHEYEVQSIYVKTIRCPKGCTTTVDSNMQDTKNMLTQNNIDRHTFTQQHFVKFTPCVTLGGYNSIQPVDYYV